jgi:hypothetical protein
MERTQKSIAFAVWNIYTAFLVARFATSSTGRNRTHLQTNCLSCQLSVAMRAET